ncbi:MAG: hypothetical protein ACTHK8_02130, partial [Ginsengibacter sp.]
MNDFKDFGIKTKVKSFIGDKIKMSKILNKKITVTDFKIDNSKYSDKGNGKCLHLQIELEDKKHVVFTGSVFLMETIQQVPKEKFPFTTT